MEVTTTKCDVCGRTEQTEDFNEPKGWYRLGRNTDRDKDFWGRLRDVCDECASKLNLYIVSEKADDIRETI